MLPRQFRQGDILLTEIAQLPKDLSSVENGLLVIGESSNHGHYVVGEGRVLKKGEDMYVSVHGTATLKHLKVNSKADTDEHAPIPLPKGTYQVIRQREYNPFEDWVEEVWD